MIFFDLRDRYGVVQVTLGPDWTPGDAVVAAEEVGQETVLQVRGSVTLRPPDSRNPHLPTGEVEVQATHLETLSVPSDLPIPVWRTKGEDPPAEELRLLHRHLDLRRPEMQSNLALRHRLLQRARAVLSSQDFLEIETPILTKPTPEGARDYLVPSRVHPGQFYALPQSPQIYKQVLMVAGLDRYFQIARCFRDEDLRADRQPEFTQIDIEASFVDLEDIFAALELTMVALWDEAGHEVQAPFERITYSEAMERYGTDKPDLRYGLEIEDVGDVLGGHGFRPFDEDLARGNRVRAIRVPGGAALSRKTIEQLTEVAKSAGLGGLATLKLKGDKRTGSLAKLDGVTPEAVRLSDGELLLAVSGPDTITSAALDRLRLVLIERLSLEPSTRHRFVWVQDFPLGELDPHSGEWTFPHHPFTAPHPEDVRLLLEGELEGVRAQHYDLVYNGHELGSGSIRIHDPDLQLAVLERLGVSRTEAERRFGFLLRGLRSGAPPHGGFAVGFDRVVMLLAGGDSLREVIAFPKTTAARALFEDSPTDVDTDDLTQLGIKLIE